MKARWRSIAGFEGQYEVSDTGLVRSLDRMTTAGARVKGRVLVGGLDTYGYPQVILSSGKTRKTAKVHQLVLSAFVGKRPSPGHLGMHKDDNPQNNHYRNLRWGTHADNRADCVSKDRHAYGQRNGYAVLTDADVIRITKRIKAGQELQPIADHFNVSYSTISAIATGRSWRHVSGLQRVFGGSEKRDVAIIKRIVRLRGAGKSLAAIADDIGMSKSYVAAVVSGRINADISGIRRTS